jgi:hypothetical protein
VHRSTSTLTNSTGIAGLCPPAASVGDALRTQQQQQQAAQAAGVEGPYSSYLDAELLSLYNEFKTTRKQVRLGCYSVALVEVVAAPAPAVQALCMHLWLKAAPSQHLLSCCCTVLAQAADTACPLCWPCAVLVAGAGHCQGGS